MCVYCHVLKKVGIGRKYFFIYLFITELMWEARMHFYTLRVTFNLFLSKNDQNLHWKAKIYPSVECKECLNYFSLKVSKKV